MKTMSNTEMNKKFAEIAQYRMLKAEAEKELEKLEGELKAYMLEGGFEELIGDEHKVTYKEETRNTFDSKAFKKAGYEDLYEAFKKPSTSRKFLFN